MTSSVIVKHALRRMGKRPFVTLLAAGSLAMAVGVTTAAFSTVDAYFLRALPVRDPASLVYVYVETREKRPDAMTWREYSALRERRGSLEGLAVQARFGPKVRLEGRDDYPITAAVSDNFFDLLGVRAARGDVFHEGKGGEQQVVLSDAYWRKAFGADPLMIGRMIDVGAASVRVIGVLPEGMAGTVRGIRVDLFVPQQTAFGAMRLVDPNASRGEFEGLARLKPGATGEQAQAELAGLLEDGRRPRTQSLVRDERGTVRVTAVFALAAFMLLFIAAANLVALRLVENEHRRREWGMMMALGAGRGRLLSQQLTETMLLVAFSGAAGLGLAAYLIRLAPDWLRAGSDYRDYFIRMDWRVALFALSSLVFVGLLLAVLPAVDAWRHSLAESIHAPSSRKASRWLGALVTVQIALITAMAYNAGLLGVSLRKISMVRPAMDTERPIVLVQGSWRDRSGAFEKTERLASELASLPGVRRVAYARRVMLSGSGGGARVAWSRTGEAPRTMRFNQVSPSYFEVTGARVVAGRAFTASDGPGSTPVVMVSQAFERALGKQAVGEYVRLDRKDWLVVGVVEDGPSVRLRETLEPFVYFPFSQLPASGPTFFVETAVSAGRAASDIALFLQRNQTGYESASLNTLFAHLRSARNQEEMAAAVGGILALLSVVMGAAGLLGVTMYAVSRRVREFGVRMALGATGGTIARLVFGRVLLYLAAGIPAGALLAWSAGEGLASLLYGVSQFEPSVMLGVLGVVCAVAAASAAWPARQASAADPWQALRAD
jgi:predicted permease